MSKRELFSKNLFSSSFKLLSFQFLLICFCSQFQFIFSYFYSLIIYLSFFTLLFSIFLGFNFEFIPNKNSILHILQQMGLLIGITFGELLFFAYLIGYPIPMSRDFAKVYLLTLLLLLYCGSLIGFLFKQFQKKNIPKPYNLSSKKFYYIISILSLGLLFVAYHCWLFKNINHIRSISYIQAKLFIYLSSSSYFEPVDHNLLLNNLKNLESPTAKTIAKFQGKSLHLNGLKNIDKATAKQLASFKGAKLYLNGLKNIDKATALALSRFRGKYLSLNGLKRNKTLYKIFTQWNNNILTFDCLEPLDKNTALILSQFKGTFLFLNKLEEIEESPAKALALFKGKALCLNGKFQPNNTIIKTLSQFKGELLYLNGLSKINQNLIKTLSSIKKRTSFLLGSPSTKKQSFPIVTNQSPEDLLLNQSFNNGLKIILGQKN